MPILLSLPLKFRGRRRKGRRPRGALILLTAALIIALIASL
jgi:hypothetical protein